MAGIAIARLLLDTAWPSRASECPQTFGVKGLTYESLLSGDIRMDTFWSFGSLELDQFVDRKIFLGQGPRPINFLKQEYGNREPTLANMRT